MKMNKKKILIAALAVCVVAILSFSTLAWFTDDDQVTNDFMFADSDNPNNPLFEIDVWEFDEATDSDTNEADKIQDGIDYDEVLPGGTYYKDARVENRGIHSMYVRATVTLQNGKYLKPHLDGKELTLFNQLNTTDWTFDNVSQAANGDLVYVFYLNAPLEKGKNVSLFKGIVVPTTLTDEQATSFATFNVNVKAEAIQSENLGDGIDTAVEAFQLL